MITVLVTVQVFHGEKELFESNHLDWIDAQTISEKCDVYTLEEYKASPSANDLIRQLYRNKAGQVS